MLPDNEFPNCLFTDDEEYNTAWKAVRDFALNLGNIEFKKYKNNYDLVSLAVNSIGSTLRYASDELKNNKTLVMQAITKEVGALAYASDILKDDEDVINLAVSKQGIYLKEASSRLKANKDIVKKAIISNPMALGFASEFLQDDDELVFFAIKQKPIALQFASYRFKSNPNYILNALDESIFYIKEMDESLKNYPVIYNKIKMLLTKDATVFKYAPKSMKEDTSFIQQLLLKNHRNIPFLYKDFDFFQSDQLDAIYKKDPIFFESFIEDKIKSKSRPLIRKQMYLKLSKNKPSFFLRALKSLDRESTLTTTSNKPLNINEKLPLFHKDTIDFILKHVSEKDLNTVKIENSYIQKCLEKQKQDRKILQLNLTDNIKPQIRKMKI